VFHCADPDSVIDHADTTMRKQFAAVSALGVLDKAKPNNVKDVAAQFGIAIEVGRHNQGKLRVEFPETKKQQKELLTFLTILHRPDHRQQVPKQLAPAVEGKIGNIAGLCTRGVSLALRSID